MQNKLGITDQAELAKQEESLSKKRAKELIETKKLFEFEIGTFKGLSAIHHYLFQDIYDFADKIRDVNLAKDDFQWLYTFYCVMILLHYTAFLIYHKIKSILVYTKRAIMASFSCVSYHENSIRKYGVHYDLFKLYYKYY